MSAATVGQVFPAEITLDDLAEMNSTDRFGHRFEMSPEGALSVMPPPDSEHAEIATKLLLWFGLAGWPAGQLFQAAGIRLRGPLGDGGRIPDLTIWSAPRPRTVWLETVGLLLAIEIVSLASAREDRVVKVEEYAAAAISRYWVVERDSAQTVTLHVLGADKAYDVAAKMPLAWLLQTKPADHGF